MTIQDQYIDTIRQTQETWAGAVESFTKDLQRTFGQPVASPFTVVDPKDAIDQVFDFWEKTLEAQRDVAKQVVEATVSATEKVREQFESVSAVVREQTESVSNTIREQAESAGNTFREQAESFRDQAESAVVTVREQAEAADQAAKEEAAKSYDDLTKAELQDELSARDLPKSGNVDELRARLVADDKK